MTTGIQSGKEDQAAPGRGGFLRDVGFFSVAQGGAGIVLAIYVFVIARLLGMDDFGLFQSLMGLQGILFTLGYPLNMATVHGVARARDEDKAGVLGGMLKVATAVGGGMALTVLGLYPWLGSMLHCSFLPMASLAIFLFACIVLTAFYGGLQGNNRYALFSAVKIVEASCSALIGLTLVCLGVGTAGAVGGYAAGMSLAVLYLATRSNLFSMRGRFSPGLEGRTMLQPLAIMGTLLLVINFPMVVARGRLPVAESGTFGVLFAMRNLVLPFALAVAVPLYSRRLSGNTDGTLTRHALVIVAVAGGGLLLASVLCPGLIIRVLFGGGYADAVPYLPAYSCALVLHAAVMVLLMNHAGRGRLRTFTLVFPVLAAVSIAVIPDITLVKILVVQIISVLLVSLPCLFRNGNDGCTQRSTY